MYAEHWVVVLSLSGGILFSLAAALAPSRRMRLATSAVILFLLLWYEIQTDRWEKTVTAPIRLDMFAEIPLMILCLIFGAWHTFFRRKRKELADTPP
jgi:hypothetical protein